MKMVVLVDFFSDIDALLAYQTHLSFFDAVALKIDHQINFVSV